MLQICISSFTPKSLEAPDSLPGRSKFYAVCGMTLPPSCWTYFTNDFSWYICMLSLGLEELKYTYRKLCKYPFKAAFTASHHKSPNELRCSTHIVQLPILLIFLPCLDGGLQICISALNSYEDSTSKCFFSNSRLFTLGFYASILLHSFFCTHTPFFQDLSSMCLHLLKVGAIKRINLPLVIVIVFDVGTNCIY